LFGLGVIPRRIRIARSYHYFQSEATTYEQALGYIELLAGETPRIEVFDMGPTSFGRRRKYAVISSEENMAKLDDYKEICRKLSLARGVTEDEARRLAGEGKAIVWIDGGLHAREVVGSHANIQLAYDPASAEDSLTKQIRDNVVLVLVWTNFGFNVQNRAQAYATHKLLYNALFHGARAKLSYENETETTTERTVSGRRLAAIAKNSCRSCYQATKMCFDGGICLGPTSICTYLMNTRKDR
jgi:hypothetical protein